MQAVLLQRARQALACSLALEGCLGPQHGMADAFPVLRAEGPEGEPFALCCRACLDAQLDAGRWVLADEGRLRRPKAAAPPEAKAKGEGRRGAAQPRLGARKPPR